MTPADEGQQSEIQGWSSDPYDPSFTKGVPMNLLESDEYDAQFPNHLLSVIRKLLREITETIGS